MDTIDKIKSLAKEKGVSITFLCQSIGQGAYYFNDVKRRGGTIPEDRLNAIADILNTTPDYLTGKTDKKEKPATPQVDVDELIHIVKRLSLDKKLELLKRFEEILREY